MTVETRIQQAMSLLKTASGNLSTFALETKDREARKFYMEAAQQLDAINDKLSARLNTVRNEEPPAADTGAAVSGLLRRRPIKKL
ncbi:MAG: DUF1657 domain-containing protein [Thermoanaerobacterales bacterium]|nr:DUF1657 domain-containing protein [Thermoanaerobacterales bacterium]